jgi:NAD(P)-dependent dehydrogenase (short-subunit alcohol dehydrogenase family)
VRINAVCPGFIRTPLGDRFFALMSQENPQISEQVTALHSIGRLGMPEEVVEVVVWPSSDSGTRR